MSDRELYYGQSGSVLYDDELIAGEWYPDGYQDLYIRGAFVSQAYVTDQPQHDLEVVRRVDVEGTPDRFVKSGSDGMPADASMTETTSDIVVNDKNLIPENDLSYDLGKSGAAWRSGYIGEITLVPKTSSSGPEGTIFFNSTDKGVYVGVDV